MLINESKFRRLIVIKQSCRTDQEVSGVPPDNFGCPIEQVASHLHHLPYPPPPPTHHHQLTLLYPVKCASTKAAYRGSCYELVLSPTSASAAEADCVRKGGHMLAITSE